MYRLIIVTFLSLILASCSMSGSADRAMQRAESLMESHPDSALAVMRQIDPSRLRGKRESALYALLLTQAQYKNYIAVTDDSLISAAVDYFDRTDDLYHQMLAYHYCGQVYNEMKLYSKAIMYSMIAHSIAKEINDNYWIAMSAYGISNIYTYTHNGSEAIKYAEIGVDQFRLINRQPQINYAMLSLAGAYSNGGSLDKAIILSTQLIDSAKKCNDSYLDVEARRTAGLAYLKMKRISDAFHLFHDIVRSDQAEISDSLYLLLTYIRLGDMDSALDLSKRCSNLSNGIGNWMKCEIYEAMDSIPQAMNSLKKMNSETDSILRNILTQNITGTVSEFYDYEQSVREAELKNTRIIIWYSAVIIVIFLIIGLVYAARYRKKQEERINRNIEIAENLREMIAINNKDAKSRIQSLLAERFDILDNLCQILYEKNNSSVAKKQVSKEIDSLIEQLSKDEKKLQELSDYIDTHYDGIMTKLKTDFPNMLDMDYRLFLYSILGFSNSAIAMFLGEEKITAVYARRKRLKNKFRTKNTKYKEDYLNIIS